MALFTPGVVSAGTAIVGNVTFSVTSESTNQGTDVYSFGRPAAEEGQSASLRSWCRRCCSARQLFLLSLAAAAPCYALLFPRGFYLAFNSSAGCLLLLMCFCMGLGHDAAALAVFFRDVMHLWRLSLLRGCI